MRFYIRIVDSINEWVGKISCWFLVPLVFITAFEVLMRYFLKRPTIWAWDVNIYIFAFLIFFSGGYTLLHNGHVTVDVLTINLPRRIQAILNIITSVFFFTGIAALFFGGWDMFKMSWKVKETMPTLLALPYYWMKLLVPAGCILLIMQGVSELFKNIIVLTGKSGIERL